MLRKIVDHLKALVGKLFSLKDTPHAIAGGVAIGVFMGFTPFFGIKTLLSIGTAYALRCNAIAAAIAVSLHDVITPLWPVFFKIEYDIGYWVLSNPHHLPPKVEIHHLKLGELFRWDTFIDVGMPLFVGSLFFSAPAAVIFYFLTLKIVQARQKAE